MSQRFLTDEDFHSDVLSGLIRRLSHLDITRVQDVGLTGVGDPSILEWADGRGRILLTHDGRTMPRHAYVRLHAGLRVAGVCVVPQSLPIGLAVDELVLVIECTLPEEWENLVRRVPV